MVGKKSINTFCVTSSRMAFPSLLLGTLRFKLRGRSGNMTSSVSFGVHVFAMTGISSSLSQNSPKKFEYLGVVSSCQSIMH